MSDSRHMREPVSSEDIQRLLERRAAEGWRPVAIEWERAPPTGAAANALHEVPYGLRVASDHQHLEDHPDEVRILLAILAGIVDDRPLSEISAELNAHGWRTRSGSLWTQSALFEMLPRLIDSSPELFRHAEWTGRTRRLVGRS
jgi:hypothetical protein